MNQAQVEKRLGLGSKAFRHIPFYCRKDAIKAIAHVRRMEEKQLLRPGVYYVVFTDLCGATVASEKLGADLNRRRVESFITLTVESLGLSHPANYAHFVKPIGDAALFLFSSFLDVHNWWNRTQERMLFYSSEWNRELKPNQREVFQLRSKTVMHVGEVQYSDGVDPVALAVNQVFKIEKLFKPGELGCTDIAKVVAEPIFRDLSLLPKLRSKVVLPGKRTKTSIWLVDKDVRANLELA